MIYFHGGGFVEMNKDVVDGMCKTLAKQTYVVMIAPDLPLAPEEPFPKAYLTALKITQHVYNNAEKLGLDKTRIMVAGEGSGANLAAAVALEMKDKILRQYLFYPMLQAFDFKTPSYIENADCMANLNNPDLAAYYWASYMNIDRSQYRRLLNNDHITADMMRTVYADYVDSSKHIPDSWNITEFKVVTPTDHEGDSKLAGSLEEMITDYHFAPLMAPDDVLKEAPAAYIITSGCDVFRDDGVMYAHRLQQAGVKAIHHNFGRAFHGFLTVKKYFFIGEIAIDMLDHNIKDTVNPKKKNVAATKWDPSKGTQGFKVGKSE